MHVVSGHLLEPGAAARHPAQLHCDQHALALHSEVKSAECGWHAVQVSDDLGSLPRTLTFSDGWMFTPQDVPAFNQLLHQLRGRSWLQRLEGSLRWILLAMVVTVVSGFAVYRYGVPWLSRAIAPHVPISVLELMGKQTQVVLDHAGFTPTQLTVQRQQQLQQAFAQLLAELQQQHMVFRVPPKLVFRSFEQGPNAFALPDGTVVLTDQMVALARNDRQLQGVLLHELGHLYHHHMMTRLVQSSILSVAAAMMVGDGSGVADTLSGAGVFLMTMSYSRDHEREADAFAASVLMTQDHNTEALTSLYRLLLADKKEGAVPVWLSTHPGLQERIEALQQARE
ncbi:Zn-dependent protease with chaperone function [Pokkaliibacter plantistimulans]|uniref:Zn-dependent protease with chaperone function n=1 Tax=Proteobacteria bacterium 228 TaxID=2083153 RepID=A0A2S5KPY7_9PROT|nr:M48 family metallopeptidase [Pokkaliibacter plantistimulans]PPC76907.1 Zn-dependent protease with chaperone function [Pokkaliibacter plantistimulans]